MSAEQFLQWLADMKSAGLAPSDRQCAMLLGLTAHGLLKMKARGCDIRTALACRALLEGLEPYP